LTRLGPTLRTEELRSRVTVGDVILYRIRQALEVWGGLGIFFARRGARDDGERADQEQASEHKRD
jgi:hypothetical protein